MNIEIIGTIASIVILISFLMDGEKKIILINIIGALIFIVYGIAIKSFSVLFLNTALLLINIYKIIK